MNYLRSRELIETLAILMRWTERDFDMQLVGNRLQDTFGVGQLKDADLRTDSDWQSLLEYQKIAELCQKTTDKAALKKTLDQLKQNIEKECAPIKAAFFTQEFSLWPSFQTVWEACGPDVQKDLVFVYGEDASTELSREKCEHFMQEYRDAGYPIKHMEDYDLDTDNPDIVFYMKPYLGYRGNPNRFFVKNVKTYTPYTAFISYCLDVQGGETLQQYFYGEPMFYHVWRIVGYSNYYRDKMIERGYRNGENVITLGHPKFDMAYRLAKEKTHIHEDWAKKIQGRKVVLWNSHFTVQPGHGVGTYFRWHKQIFSYFAEHTDMVLLWRPHPLFWETMERELGSEAPAFNQFVHDLSHLDNVIVDKSSDYRHSFCMSDALISDAATFLVEYMASGNPVLYTIKEDGETVCNDDYLAGVDIARKDLDMTQFLDDLRTGKSDKKRQTRKKLFEEIFGSCDGKIGQRIWESLRREMDEDIRQRAQARLEALVEDKK